jgi:hypothetical protein
MSGELSRLERALKAQRFRELDSGYRGRTPGYSEYASEALKDLFPTPLEFLAATQIPGVADAAGAASDLREMANNPESRSLGHLALSAAGLLPFVPNMTRILDMPYMHGGIFASKPAMARSETFEIYENPTEPDLKKLLAKERRLRGNKDEAIRLLEGPDSLYGWGSSNALHHDVAKYLNLPTPPGAGPVWDYD